MDATSSTILRGDLNIVVEEAVNADKYFIGQRALPMFGVPLQSAKYPKFTKATTKMMDGGSTVRAPKSSYPRGDRAFTYDTYTCLDRGYEELVDDVDQSNTAAYFNSQSTTARLAMRQFMLDYEARVAAEIMNATTFGAGTNSKVAYTYANRTTIDFPTDVLDAIERVNDAGGVANTLILSSTVLNRLKATTLLQNFCRGSLTTDATLNLTAQAVANAFSDNGITQVLVGRARYNNAKAGQAYSAANVWGNTYVWVGEVQAGDPSAGGAGRTFVWNKEGGLFVTETYYVDSLRSTAVRVRQNTVEKIIDASAGTLITTQYSA